MKISKKDIVLIVITVIMLGVLIGGFIYDRTPALLDRTNYFLISEDDNLRVSQIEKHGFLYNRAAYEAKIEILDGYWETYYFALANLYQNEGQLMDFKEFKKYADMNLDKVSITPSPDSKATVWLMGTKLELSNAQKNAIRSGKTSETSAPALDLRGGTAQATDATTVAYSSYDGATAVYIIDQESDGKAYLYIYYSK
ncbi:MAG: hypothetical protein J6X33_01315 [Clostridiales bacterium]|nr:hypothetical protein [Clostridiales bacterium]